MKKLLLRKLIRLLEALRNDLETDEMKFPYQIDYFQSTRQKLQKRHSSSCDAMCRTIKTFFFFFLIFILFCLTSFFLIYDNQKQYLELAFSNYNNKLN